MSDTFNTEAFDASIKDALEKDGFTADELLSSPGWNSVRLMMSAAMALGGATIAENAPNDPVIPTLFGMPHGGGNLAICPVFQLLDPSVNKRKATMLMVPGNLDKMNSDFAVLMREAWTVTLMAPKGEDSEVAMEAVRKIRPSEDDRRVSTLTFDVITPDYQFMVNYKIKEGAQRSVHDTPFSALAVKVGGVMRTTAVPDLARKPFSA